LIVVILVVAAAAAGLRGDEAGRGAGAARPVQRSQAAAAEPEGTKATSAANPEGPQALAAAREEGSRARARAAASGKAAACHPRGQQPTGTAPRAHVWIEEGRRPVILIIACAAAAGAVKERGEEAQEKDWYVLQIFLFGRSSLPEV